MQSLCLSSSNAGSALWYSATSVVSLFGVTVAAVASELPTVGPIFEVRVEERKGEWVVEVVKKMDR